jgi:ribosomal protein S18 acetylase RimI-like enzyme
MHIRPFQIADEPRVIDLWRRCDLLRPWNDPHQDIARKMKVNPELFLVGFVDDKILATVMAGYEGHRGWINYLAVDPDQRRGGLGRAMMAEAERLLAEVGCPKINLQVRSSNAKVIEFYRAIGYGTDDVVSMGKRLKNDDPAARQ